ncbi:hypothetical protein [Methylorubrum extorquens]|uniref:DUF3618 domain-containing protein n=1 Tax=Methylorubrum extorquens TaxID=408 RepID=A0AAX3WF98_METEX|nr:hypothetical protein [Methylorubrum extorquens]WHQ69486.1 hypothetical protein KEC54_24625 [Methylorubrum extorquens]
MTTQPSGLSNIEARLERNETRLDGFGAALSNLAQGVTALGDKIDKRGQTPWSVIWSALATLVGVLTVVGGLAYYPIKEGQADMKSALLLLQDRSDKRLEALAGSQVSRAEHEVHWRMQEREVDAVRERIGRVEDRLTTRIERLEGPRLRPPG